MTAFEPGKGFREVEWPEYQAAGVGSVRYEDVDGPHFWVREEPAPALPTEPYTVIRVTNRDGETSAEFVLRRDAAGKAFWQFLSWGTGQTAEDLTNLITGFKVLAEPTPRVALYEEQQRVARDVIARIAAEPWAREIDLQKLRDECGVES